MSSEAGDSLPQQKTQGAKEVRKMDRSHPADVLGVHRPNIVVPFRQIEERHEIDASQVAQGAVHPGNSQVLFRYDNVAAHHG